MVGFVFFAVVVLVLVALDLAAARWGVDSRTMSPDERPLSLFVH